MKIKLFIKLFEEYNSSNNDRFRKKIPIAKKKGFYNKSY